MPEGANVPISAAVPNKELHRGMGAGVNDIGSARRRVLNISIQNPW